MKIKSKIDEIVCTSITINNRHMSGIPTIGWSIGYKGEGMNLGELSIAPGGNLASLPADVLSAVTLLMEGLEKYYASNFSAAEDAQQDKPREIEGLVKEF